MLACLASLGIMSSCEKESVAVSDEKAKSLIVGEWECTSVDRFRDGFVNSEFGIGGKYNFTSDGVVFVTFVLGSFSGPHGYLYAISNGTLVVLNDNYTIEKLDNNSLKLSWLYEVLDGSTGNWVPTRRYATFKRI